MLAERRRPLTVTSYQVQLSDGQESTVIADAAQRRSAAERSTATVSLHDVARTTREGQRFGLNR